MSQADAPVPQVRASDAEREQVAEIVRRAVGDGRLTIVEGDERLAGVYGTTYRGGLRPYVADLGEVVPADAPTAEPARAAADLPVRRTSIAVFSGVNRTAEWAPGPAHQVVAVMGGAELSLARATLDPTGVTIDVVAVMGGAKIDLRDAPIGPGGLTVRVVAMMGGAEVVVDQRTRVVENGIGVMGAFVDESGAATGGGGPTVRVTGVAFMGGVNVKRQVGGGRAGLPES